MDRDALILRRTEVLEELRLFSPARMATDLGPAPNEEYEAYLKTYDRLTAELADLNKQLGLPENSQQSLV